MRRVSKLVVLREKSDADDFISYEVEEGNKESKKYFLPTELSGKKVKVEFVLGKKQRKIIVVSLPHSNKFYKIRPSSINYNCYDA